MKPVLALLLLLVACGRATGPQYRGVPLAVVNGRMTADRNIALKGDLRLAVAWFTAGSIGATQPDAIHTQSVIYEPVFPAGFSFGLYDLPLVGTGKVESPVGGKGAAVGVLMAYDDRNRNGALDTYRAGERPVDVVLGTSLGTFAPVPDPSGFFILLVTDVADPKLPPGAQRGLNLVRMTGEVVGFDTQVPLHLDGAIEWNLFLCEELLQKDRRTACLDSLRPPDAGVVIDSGFVDSGVADAGLTVSISGSVGFSNSSRNAALSVTVGGVNRPDASVEMNGVPLVFDSPSNQFRLQSGAPASSVVIGGDNLVQVRATDAQPFTMGFFMPGDFRVTAPAFNASFPSSTPFSVAWTDSRDAGSYRVTVYRSTPFASVFAQAGILASPFMVPPIAYQGSATLSVEASMPIATGPNGSFIFPYVNQSIPVTLQ